MHVSTSTEEEQVYVDKDSITAVRCALVETTRHFDEHLMQRIEKPLQGDDRQSDKLKRARYWLLRLRYLERRAREYGVEFSENGGVHHQV